MPGIIFRLLLGLCLLAAPLAARAVLLGVTVQGINGELKENVEKQLGIVQVIKDDRIPDSHVAWLHSRAPEQIREALAPFGYYRVKVDASLEETPEGLEATYRINPGPPVKVIVRDLVLKGPGGSDAALSSALASFPLRKGDVLDHRKYESGKREIQRLLAERGYFDAEMTEHAVKVDPDALSAEIHLHFDTGPRYRLGPVQFDGAQFPAEFMQRFVQFDRGEPYDQSTLLALQKTLLDTDYFASVNVNAVRDSAQGLEVPVRVTVSPNKRNIYSAGVGYGTDTGARVQGAVERRWVNRRGHRLRVEAQVGERKSGVDAQYGIPVHRGNVQQYALGASYKDEQSDTVDSRGAELSVSQVARWRGWDRVIALKALVERFKLRTGAQPDALKGTQNATVLYPVARLSKTRSNDPVVPTRGWELQAYVRGGLDSLLSDTSFAQLGAGAKLILPAWGRDRILLRADAATTWADKFERLPPSLRYFAGGDYSVRGYDYQSLAPTNDQGTVIGGKYLLVGSAEYEHMFTEHWGMALFSDAGNAFSNTRFNPEVGTGVGLRWRSPVGMVRVDVASAVTQPGNPLQLHVVIGPDL